MFENLQLLNNLVVGKVVPQSNLSLEKPIAP